MPIVKNEVSYSPPGYRRGGKKKKTTENTQAA